MIKLRPYQKDLINSIRNKFKEGKKRVVLCAPTGSGKTIMFSYMVKEHLNRGGRVLIFTHRKELLHQAGGSFVEFGLNPENIESENKPDLTKNLHVSMIETFYRRIKRYELFLNSRTMIIVDECHINNFTKVLDKVSKSTFVIGATATPYRKGNKVPELSEFYDDIVQNVSISDLIERGFLSNPKTMGVKIDMSSMKKRGDDYDTKEYYQETKMWAGVLNNWERLCKNTKTILFSSNVQSSKDVCQEFLDRGYDAKHLDGNTSKLERKKILDWFDKSNNGIICNCGILTTGFDQPDIETVILYRATTSLPLFLQMCLDLKTEILTKNGWKKHYEVNKGDVVAVFDKNNNKISYQECEEKIFRKIDRSENFYSISSPHLDIRVTNKHNLLYRTRTRNKNYQSFKLLEAEKVSSKKSSYEIPISGFTNNKDVKELSDSDLMFIGWVLSDGTINKRTKNITIYQSESQPKYLHESIKKSIEESGFKYSTYRSVRKGKLSKYSPMIYYNISYGNPRGTEKHLSGWSRLEKYLDKNISDDLMSISKRQLSVLLKAINYGDGKKNKTAYWNPKTMSIAMGDNKIYADRLQELCIKNGYKCNMSTLHYNKRLLYMLYIKNKTYSSIKGFNEKDGNHLLKEEWKEENVWCVRTKKGTIITRRNGKVSIMGNCGRGSRIYPGKDHFNILDFGNNVSRLGFWEADREWKLTSDKKRSSKKGVQPIKECPKCEAMLPANARKCEHCGYVFETSEKEKKEAYLEELTYQQIKGKIKDMTIEEMEELRVAKQYKLGWLLHNLEDIGQLIEYAQMKGYKSGWVDRTAKRLELS